MPAHLRDLVGVRSQKAEHRRKYLQFLVDLYQYLQLSGIGTHDKLPAGVPLLDVWVPLKARLDDSTTRAPAAGLRLSGRPLPPEEAAEVGGRLGGPEPILDLLRAHPGVVILGDPGAGKTTVLAFLALKLARLGLADGAAPGDDELGLGPRLPVLAPLSAYAAALEQNDVRLDDFIVDHYRGRGLDVPLRPMVDEAFRQGSALVLLDGLDEVREHGRRRLVVNRVVDFFSAHREAGNKFVVTSRIVGYRDVRRAAEGLAECTLLDFDDEDIAAFVGKWTLVVEHLARGKTAVAAREAARERGELLVAIRRNPAVRSLAANPLLLTILALMKRQGTVLPDRRVELYDRYVETLLRHWCLARSLDRPPDRRFDPKQDLRVLAPLALWMQETSPGRGLVGRAQLERRLEEIHRDRGFDDPEAAARQFLADVEHYTGILSERGAGQYGFLHLTFQEYLAAIGIAQLGQADPSPIETALRPRFDQAAWREVVLLTIAYVGIVQGREEPASAVVERILVAPPGTPGHAVALVGEAVADMKPGGVTRDCGVHLEQALLATMRDDVRVAPAERAACGDALARLGDPRFRTDAWHLPNEPLLGFVEIHAGRFRMGSDERKDQDAADWETPAHDVDLPAYYIGRYPVTVAQFRAFVEDAKVEVGGKDCLRGLPNHPVVSVSWDDALAYCTWLTAKLRDWAETPEPLATRLRRGEKGGRPWVATLPSEAEWEKAARGSDGRLYPWGNDFDPNKANSSDTRIGRTTAVGCFPGGTSPLGLEDASGNVWEWTRSENLQSREDRVLRGGAFVSHPMWLRCAFRNWYPPSDRGGGLGFRVVASPFGDRQA